MDNETPPKSPERQLTSDKLGETSALKIGETSALKIGDTSVVFITDTEDDVLEKPKRIRKRRRVQRVKKVESFIPGEIFEVPGVAKIKLSLDTQKSIYCVVGEDITDENPWKYVQKEDVTDNLELYEDESDFFLEKDTILAYPHLQILVGYIPTQNQEVEDFYICATESAEATVAKIMERVKMQREERLNNTLLKSVGTWKTQGSEKEVNQQIIKENRPLLEMEFETGYPVMAANTRFRLRMAEDAQDGYAALLCTRATFTNLQRKMLTVGVQVTPSVITSFAQTNCSYPRNVSTEYKYEYQEIEKLSKEFCNNVKSFVNTRMDKINDMIYVNSYINFYSNDYLNLVKSEQYTHKPTSSSHVKEYFSFYEPNLAKGKIINSLSWHPMWSGTLAVAYSYDAKNNFKKHKSNYDEVVEALYNVSPVLLWCFNDNLTAKLLLKSPREVTALSFCPYDENVLVGGCVNGQVIIWDITDRLRKVEENEILTVNQQRYRARMMSLMAWMKDVRNPKVVEATVVSELLYSHKGPITEIVWHSAHREVSKSGKLTDIPEDEDRTSRQFMTSSDDGTVLTWNLLSKPVALAGGYKPQRKLRRLKRRPSALIQDVSPYRALNRLFRPMFKIIVNVPNTARPLPITALSIRTIAPIYQEKYPDPTQKFNICNRILYEPIFIRPTHPLLNQFIAGSAEGDFVIATWEGFEYNAGEVVNKETAKITNFGKYHDGPVVSVTRSSLIPDLLLSVGGKVFALWKISFMGKPVFWRKGKCRYTHGRWNLFRSTVFRLTREDGKTEAWHLKIRSDRYAISRAVSQGPLLGCFTHPRTMKVNVFGILDYTGALRLFTLAPYLVDAQDDDKRITENICDREVDKKQIILTWQEQWKQKNSAWIAADKEKAQAIKKQKEEESQAEQERKFQLEGEGAQLEPESTFAERAQESWKQKELDRMTRGLLHKKQLNMELLLKQQTPILKMAAEECLIEKRKIRRANNAQKLFDETVAMLFPAAIAQKPPPPPDPYGGGDSFDVRKTYYKTYKVLEEESENTVKKSVFFRPYSWLNTVKGGKKRRRWLDGYYERTSHKDRIIREEEDESSRPVYVSVPVPTVRSSESLIYEVEEENEIFEEA